MEVRRTVQKRQSNLNKAWPWRPKEVKQYYLKVSNEGPHWLKSGPKMCLTFRFEHPS